MDFKKHKADPSPLCTGISTTFPSLQTPQLSWRRYSTICTSWVWRITSESILWPSSAPAWRSSWPPASRCGSPSAPRSSPPPPKHFYSSETVAVLFDPLQVTTRTNTLTKHFFPQAISAVNTSRRWHVTHRLFLYFTHYLLYIPVLLLVPFSS